MHIVRTPIPLFNTPYFLNRPQLDASGLWRALETILLVGNTFAYQEEGGIVTVTTPNYPSTPPLYTDIRFIERSALFDKNTPSPLSLQNFLDKIQECVQQRIPYLWGGNLPKGDDRMGRLLYSLEGLSKEEKRACLFKGVDCSGLLYWASFGTLPRNSSLLIYTGEPVTTLDSLKPGMLIGWKGHVLIVTEKGIVESAVGKGVICTPTQETIAQLLKTRQFLPAWSQETPCFVVRDLRPLLEKQLG